MYFDLSARKSFIMVAITIVLLFAVAQTFALKDDRYGSTPPLASLGIALQELTTRTWYAVEGALWRVSATLRSAYASLFGGRETAGGARAIPVLTYHRIVTNQNDLNNVTVANFKDQMTTLKNAGWETMTLKEYREFMAGERDLPERSFLVTFDDGAKESFYPVDPLFEALGYEGVMYVIDSGMRTEESTYYLSPTEVHRMLKSGRWEIGSHSFDGHRPYAADAGGTEGIFFADKLWLPEEGRIETTEEFRLRVRNDLSRARARLEAEFGTPIDTFAFPLGNETGVAGAGNFPEGASITEREASDIYSLGFLQTNQNRFSFNYPDEREFLAYRIHVDYDWSGARLLEEMEGGLPKMLPLEDDFSLDRGWISSWGALELGRNNLVLRAEDGASSASAFLDGSRLWDDYSYSAAFTWRDGSVFLLADVQNSKTYHSCAFSPGMVRVQSTAGGETRVLAETRDSRIAYGDNLQAGIRVHGSVIECLWNFESIAEAYEREGRGGIGIQVWDPDLGTAAVTVSEILVRPNSQGEASVPGIPRTGEPTNQDTEQQMAAPPPVPQHLSLPPPPEVEADPATSSDEDASEKNAADQSAEADEEVIEERKRRAWEFFEKIKVRFEAEHEKQKNKDDYHREY